MEESTLNETVFEVKKETMNTLKKSLNEDIKKMYVEIDWLNEMYRKMGEAKAQGFNIVRDEETNQNYTDVTLKVKKKEIFNDFKVTLEGNFKSAIEFKGRKKKARSINPDSKAKNNFSIPNHASPELISFFNSVDLGKVNGKKTQTYIAGLNGDGILSSSIVRNLFDIYLKRTNLMDGKKVVKKGLNVGGIYIPEKNFIKFFSKQIEELAENDSNKYKPIKNHEIEVEGHKMTAQWVMPYPTSIMSLIPKLAPNSKEPGDKEKYLERLINESKLLSEHKASLISS